MSKRPKIVQVEDRSPDVERLLRRLDEIITERGLNWKQVSLASGLGETGVSGVFKAKSGPRIDTLLKIVNQLGITLADLVDAEKHPPGRRIPIVGCASAGEGWAYFEGDGPLGYVTLSIDVGESIAIEVKGSSMTPVYRDGDILIGTKRFGQDVSRLVGMDCIIESTLGRRFVKFIAKGTSKLRYNLRSYEPYHKDIVDIDIAWAAPIKHIVRTQR